MAMVRCGCQVTAGFEEDEEVLIGKVMRGDFF